MSRLFAGAAAAALTLAACAAASTATAQSYNRLVVFGDSLTDNGNLFAAAGQPPAPYFQGRFSNGPTFVELLGFNLARVGGNVNGNIDYAYGGSRTDNNVAFPPGMRQQLTNYTSAGGQFGRGDLVSVLGGANNIFQSIGLFATLPATNPAVANPTGFVDPTLTAAVADINFIVNDIAGRGAGTILVTNLPRLGVTPQFRTSPAAALADYAGSTFNSRLQTALLTLAPTRPNTNIILFDLGKISDTLVANPGRFGLSNVQDKCFTGTSVCANPDSYLYWDDVHPTAAGHRLIAALAEDYLYYGDIGAQSAVEGETAYRHREEALEVATDRLSGREAWSAGTALTMSGSLDRVKTDARGVVGEAESNGYSVSGALESGPSEKLRFGLAGTYRKANVDVTSLGFDLETLSLDIYGGWRSRALFVNASAGAAHDDYKITRTTQLNPIVHDANTDGASFGGRVQGGAWFDMGGIAISPRAAITYATSDVDGYYENGVAAQYEYGRRTVQATTAEASLRAEATIGAFGVFAEGGYRDNIDENTDAVRVGINGNPAQILSRTVEDPFGGQVLASAGVQGNLGKVKVDIGYRGRFGDHADSHVGAITFRLPI